MLRTTVHLHNVWVPPPPPVEGYWKKQLVTTVTDLSTGHHHVADRREWDPNRGNITNEELAAAAKIDAIHPPRNTAMLVASRDETREEEADRLRAANAGPQVNPAPPPETPVSGAVDPTGRGQWQDRKDFEEKSADANPEGEKEAGASVEDPRGQWQDRQTFENQSAEENPPASVADMGAPANGPAEEDPGDDGNDKPSKSKKKQSGR